MGENECRSFRMRELELVNTGSVFIDFQNKTDYLKGVLFGDWETVDAIAKWLGYSTKKKLNTEEEKCGPDLCCLILYNVNVMWVDCRECI